MSTTVGFIGIGNMASAIIRGLITSGLVNASDIVVSSRDHARREALPPSWGCGPWTLTFWWRLSQTS